MNQTIKTSVGLAIIIIFGITVGAFTWYILGNDSLFQSSSPATTATAPSNKNITPGGPAKMCTQEVRTCPDGSYVARTGPNCEFASCPGKENQSAKKSGSEMIQVDDIWNIYENHKLGFSLLVPSKTNSSSDDKNGKSFGDVALFEEGNIVFIYSKDDPYLSEDMNQLKGNGTEYDKASGASWAILVKSAANDQELEKFIKDRYGNECKLGAKTLTSVNNLYDVSVISQGPESECFLNYMFKIKYDPVKKKVASWDLGQDVNFVITSRDDGTDEKMSDSFRFID